MKHDFNPTLKGNLPLFAPQESEFEIQEVLGGAPSRRRFLKRTGGATLSSIIAWNSLTQSARGQVVNDQPSGSGIYKAWQIRVDEVKLSELSSGSASDYPDQYDHDNNPNTAKVDVRKILLLEVFGEKQADWAGSAASEIVVTVTESAEYEADPLNDPDRWTRMEENEFKTFNNGFDPDVHTKTATITKTINPNTGSITNTTKDPQTYNETEDNINLDLSWDGDKLIIKWKASDVAEETKSVEPVFHRRYFSSQAP